MSKFNTTQFTDGTFGVVTGSQYLLEGDVDPNNVGWSMHHPIRSFTDREEAEEVANKLNAQEEHPYWAEDLVGQQIDADSGAEEIRQILFDIDCPVEHHEAVIANFGR